MKKCTKCGFENDDNNKFCGECGGALSEKTNSAQICQKCRAEFASGLKYCPECGTAVKKSKKFPVVFCAGVAVIAVITGCVLALNPRESISQKIPTISSPNQTAAVSEIIQTTAGINKIILDAQDFCDISYSGYSGYAKGELIINSNALSYILDDEDIDLAHADKLKVHNILKNMTGSLSSQEISNGDNIKVSLHYDDSALTELGVELSSQEIDFKASGLSELTLIDPFKDMRLYTTGLSGYAFVDYLDISESEYYWLLNENTNFSIVYQYIGQDGHIKNGDTLTVKVECNESNLLNYGYKLSVTEAIFNINFLQEPLFNFYGISNLKNAMLIEANNFCDSSSYVDSLITTLTPYAYLYKPAISSKYYYRDVEEGSFEPAMAAALFSSTNGAGEDTYEIVVMTDIYKNGDGSFSYSLYRNNNSVYDIYDGWNQYAIGGTDSAENQLPKWINFFERFGNGLTQIEYAGSGVIQSATGKIVVTFDNQVAIDRFSDIFSTNSYAATIIAKYALASDAFISLFPESANMELNEVAKKFNNDEFIDEWRFDNNYLCAMHQGELMEEMFRVPCTEVEKYFSENISYFKKR